MNEEQKSIQAEKVKAITAETPKQVVENGKPKNKRKKILIISIVIILLLFLLLMCLPVYEEYPYNHIGIYDTKISQYIDIGDDRENIEKKLGRGKKTEYESIDYPNNLSIRYDDDDKVERIWVYYDFMGDDNSRYTFVDGIGCNSTVTDFINKYGYVYEFSMFKGDTKVCIVVYNQDDKYILLSKEDMIKMQEEQVYANEVYTLTIAYSSYDDLEFIEVEKVNPEFYDWEQYLKEIEK